MSKGVMITIPEDCTTGDVDEVYYLSTDQATNIAAQLINGIAQEYINGTQDLEDNFDTRRDMKRSALGEVKNEMYGPYERM